MTKNERKILIIAICAVVLIGVAATLFTTPSTAARKGNGQGMAIASESCGAESGCSVGFKYRNSCSEENCTKNPENCNGDCDNCEECECSCKNRTSEKDTAAADGQELNQGSQDKSEQAVSQGSNQVLRQGSGQGIGRKDGQGCGQYSSAGCDR
jgi:hypothetical protein